MAELGYNYGLNSILNSELRVLKYLDYKINRQTPYHYLGILIEVLCNNAELIMNSTKIDFNAFYTIGVKVLEGFCYYRNEIYSKFFEIANERIPNNIDRYFDAYISFYF